MDEAFFMRAQRLLGERRPLRIGHDDLVARVTALQADSPTARVAAAIRAAPADADGHQPLSVLLLGEHGWRGCVPIQEGCFSRAAAKRRVNGP